MNSLPVPGSIPEARAGPDSRLSGWNSARTRATYTQIARRLEELGIWNTGPIDRGFMDSIYFRDPNGQLLEMACFKFTPPEGHTYADVLSVAHRMRVEKGDYAISDNHLADAIAELTEKKIKISA